MVQDTVMVSIECSLSNQVVTLSGLKKTIFYCKLLDVTVTESIYDTPYRLNCMYTVINIVLSDESH